MPAPFFMMQHIRNFSIIAHIDHGKSTLADRFIQLCGGLSDREMEEQVLDSMDLERERGITIKAQTAALQYKARDGNIYNLNLIDTPGHVDFSYEVSRSLAACEGAVLVVDASQGVEAQTVANCYTAIEQGVEVVPVLNKIDLPSADPEGAIREIEDVIGIDAKDALRVSAKTGEGVQDILEAVIARIPPPKGDPDGAAQGADHRFLVRQLCRRGHAGADDGWDPVSEGQDPAHVSRHDTPVRAGRRVHAEVAGAPAAGRGRGGFRHFRHQGTGGGQGGRHHHPGGASGSSAAARLQGDQAAGVRRPVSGRSQPVRRAARRAEQAEAQRRLAAIRAGSVAGARLRLPLRLPRPAAHGHRAGAARARVRPESDHHRADGGVRGADARRHAAAGGEPGQDARSFQDRGDTRAHHHHHHFRAAGTRRRDHDPVHAEARRAERTCSTPAGT